MSIVEDIKENQVVIFKWFSKNDLMIKTKRYYTKDLENDHVITRFQEDNHGTYKNVKKGLLIFDDYSALEKSESILKFQINQELYLLDSTSLNLYETFEVNNIRTMSKLAFLNKSLEQFAWEKDVNPR